MKQAKQIFFVLYLLTALLTMAEYLFVRGLFTSFLFMGAMAVLGAVNLALELKDHQPKCAALYGVGTLALIFAYLPWL